MRITVVGDTLLDEDVFAHTSRLCPDSAAPVLEVTNTVSRAGGAGLVATMLRHDGRDVELVTAMGLGADAERLCEHLDGIRLITCPSAAPVPVKSRLSSEGQLICRVDRNCDKAPDPVVNQDVLDAIACAEAVVVADYGRGLVSNRAVREALERRGREIPVVWDPHPRGAQPVPTSRLVTPNLSEAAAAAGTEATVGQAAHAARRLSEQTGCRGVAVTLGEQGALLQDAEESVLIPATRVVTTDACGAGDRFAAAAVVSLADGADLRQATRAAVDAAGRYLEAGGVRSLEARPLPRARDTSADADLIARRLRAAGGTVVATGGCFDLLHAGHVRTLEAARALGDCLIVCLNSDSSVRRLKGTDRPIIPAGERAEMLRAIGCVDAVVVFEEDGPEEVLTRLKPDIWVKGGDYETASLPESRVLETWGGHTVILPYHWGRSTTCLAAALADVS